MLYVNWPIPSKNSYVWIIVIYKLFILYVYQPEIMNDKIWRIAGLCQNDFSFPGSCINQIYLLCHPFSNPEKFMLILIVSILFSVINDTYAIMQKQRFLGKMQYSIKI